MTRHTQDLHEEKIREIAADFQQRGYEVLVEPSADQLPEFLAGFSPDLIARGPDDSVVVEVKVGTMTAASERFGDLAEAVRHQPGWRFSLAVVDSRSDIPDSLAHQLLSRDEILVRITKCTELVEAGIREAGFLLLWSSIEALLRHLAAQEKLPLERVPSSALLKELFSLGVINRKQLEIAQRLLSIRNSVVHGFEAGGLDQGSGELLQLARELIEELDTTAL